MANFKGRAVGINGGYAYELALYGYLAFKDQPTTAPTTGLTKGDVFVVNGSTNMQLALCISTAANTLRYFVPNTVTFGRDTLA